jgi:uncharacterized protein YkwD
MNKLIALFLALLFVSSSSAQFRISETKKLEEFKKNEEFSAILAQAESLFVEKVNAYRKQKKLKALKTNPTLNVMALNHTQWMRHHKKLTHRESTGSHFFSGTSLFKRLEFVDNQTHFTALAENVAYVEFTSEELNKTAEELVKLIAEEFFDSWKNSPGHRENLLDKDLDFCGVSFLKSGKRFYGSHVLAARGE